MGANADALATRHRNTRTAEVVNMADFTDCRDSEAECANKEKDPVWFAIPAARKSQVGS